MSHVDLRVARLVPLMGLLTTSCLFDGHSGGDDFEGIGSMTPGPGDDDSPDHSEDDPGNDDESCDEEDELPNGARCDCQPVDCDRCSIDCVCDEACYEDATDCLIYVQNGAIHARPELDPWELACRFVEASDDPEFPVAAHLACDGRNGCDDDDDSDDDDDDSDPDDDDDDDDSDPACPVPVPGNVVLTGPVWAEYDVQFYVPFPDWAFATAQAWWLHEEATKTELWLPLSPSFYFATALKESYMGCNNTLPEPDPFQPGRIVRREHSYIDGCLQLESTTAWTELCRMFADELDCENVGHREVVSSLDQDLTGRDNFASSTIAKSFYHAFAFSLIPRVLHLDDPSAWFSTATDHLILAKSMARLYNRGAFSGTIAGILAECHDISVAQCLHEPLEYTSQIMEYTLELEAEVATLNCYNEMVSVADVGRYLDNVLLIFRDKDEAAIKSAASAAFLAASGGAETAPFQTVALDVIRTVHDHLSARLHCPAQELEEYYQADCPLPLSP